MTIKELSNYFYIQKQVLSIRERLEELEMQLLNLKNNGELYFEGVEDDFIDEIALEIDEDAENVKVTVMYLIKNGLIEEIDADKFALTETKQCIEIDSVSAERVRKHRALKNDNDLLQCNTIETICNTEKEIEKELEIDIEIDSVSVSEGGAYDNREIIKVFLFK